MYDARNEAHEFVGDTRDEAIRKATDFFGVPVDELEIGGFPEGEVYGLGGRSLVVASLRNRRVPSAAGRPQMRASGREEGGRGDRRRRGGRGGGERREAPEPVAEPEPQREARESTEPSVGTAAGEIGEIGQFLLGVIERMDIGSFQISEATEENLRVFELQGDAASALASGDGRAVDALQLLANQVAKRGDSDVARVVVDVEGNAEAREDFLGALANRAASRARKSGRSVALDPMNGRDRRTIHMALRDTEGVATMSVGEGRYRQVVIVPDGAPDYAKALRESKAARSEGDR